MYLGNIITLIDISITDNSIVYSVRGIVRVGEPEQGLKPCFHVGPSRPLPQMYLVVFYIIIFYQLGISGEILVGAYRPSTGSGASGREGWGGFLGALRLSIKLSRVHLKHGY